jgi:hypothetical protein
LSVAAPAVRRSPAGAPSGPLLRRGGEGAACLSPVAVRPASRHSGGGAGIAAERAVAVDTHPIGQKHVVSATFAHPQGASVGLGEAHPGRPAARPRLQAEARSRGRRRDDGARGRLSEARADRPPQPTSRRRSSTRPRASTAGRSTPRTSGRRHRCRIPGSPPDPTSVAISAPARRLPGRQTDRLPNARDPPGVARVSAGVRRSVGRPALSRRSVRRSRSRSARPAEARDRSGWATSTTAR